MKAQKGGIVGEGLWAKLRRDARPQSPSSSPSDQGDGQREQTGARKVWTPRSPRPGQDRSANTSASGAAASGPPVDDSESAEGTDQSPGKKTRRNMNPRLAGGAGRRGPPRVTAGAEDGGIPMAGGEGFRKRHRGKDSDDAAPSGGAFRGADIPPVVLAMLSDEALTEAAKSGNSIDTRGMDPVDAFFAELYLESLKTEDNSVRSVIESPKFRRAQLPKPRSIHQLMASLHPAITSVAEGTDGHKLSSQAWQVISRNYYVNEADKVSMCNEIARLTEMITKESLKIHDDKMDMIFRDDFKKGYLGIEEEKRRLLMSQNEEALRAAEDFGDYGDETNWEVEAVVDEDEL
jgi:hypothetical protein